MIHLGLKKKFDFYIGGLGVALLYFPVRILGLILHRDHQLKDPKHLAVLKILGGGSLLMIYPVLSNFREKNPQTKITLICGRSIQNFAEMYKIFDEIKVIDDRSFFQFVKTGLSAFFFLLKNVDVTLDLEIHSRITTLLTTLSLVKNRVGLIDNSSLWRKRIYTHGIFVSASGSMAAAYDTAGPLFGLRTLNLSSIRETFCQQIDRETLPKDFSSQIPGQVDIAIGMGCSDLAFERQMSVKDWAQLLTLIKNKLPQVRFVFLGGPADQTLSRAVFAEAPHLAPSCHDLCGKVSLAVSLKVIHECRLFIGIDSALIHLARTLGTPSVSFWGPTSPDSLLRDWPQQELKVFSRLHCSPCVHQTETPPCHGKNVCMDHRSKFDDVLNFTTQILQHQKLDRPALKESARTTWIYTPEADQIKTLSYEVK